MDNILDSFYIPALSASKKYYRMAGYFSSGSISVAARGIRNLIKNGGRMQLVTGVNISEEDRKAIEEGLDTADDVLTKNIMSELEKFTVEDFTLQPLQAFAWMLKNNILEIKFVDMKGPGLRRRPRA